MEAAVLGVERAAPRRAAALGPGAWGATEGFGTLILAPHLACLTQKHPQLSIDLLALPRMLHLSRREADIIISLERPTRGSVIVVRLTDYVLHLYGQRDYLARSFPVTQREDLCHHAFISYVDDLLFTKELQFLDALHQPERLRFAAPASPRNTKPCAPVPGWPCCRPSGRPRPAAAAGTAPAGAFYPHLLDEHAGRVQIPGAHAGRVGFLKETVQREQALLVPGVPEQAA